MSKKIRRKINCYSQDDELLGTYSSIEEAVQMTGANPRGIQNCLRGTQFTSGGFRWDQETIREDDIVYISYFSYPYFYTIDGEKVHINDTYFDEHNILRKKILP